MKDKKEEFQKYYSSIDDIPVYNFDRYLATKDNNWFIIGFDGRQKKTSIPYEIEDKIMEEYYKAIEDRQFQVKLQKWAKIDNLITKYKVVSEIISIMYNGFPDTKIGQETRILLINELKSWRFKMPVINTFMGDVENLNRISNEINGIKNQVALLQSELKTDSKSEQISLYKQLAIIQIGLGLNCSLDPKTLVVSQWIEYVKLMQEKAKKN